MLQAFRSPVAAVVCLAVLIPLASCHEDSADPDVPTCTGTFVTPADSAVLATATTCNVRWQADLGDAVDIALLKDEQPVGLVAEGAPNSGYFPWIVSTFGQAAGDGYRLRVAAAGDDSCGVTGGPLHLADSDACDLAFDSYIPGAPVGTELDIYWASKGSTGQVNLDLMHLGRVVARIGRNLPDTGHTTWTVSTYGEDTGRFWLVLTDTRIPSCSAASQVFTILEPNDCLITVSTPTLARVLVPGSTVEVEYWARPSVGPLEAVLYVGTTRLGSLAVDLDPTAGTWQWQVTDLGHGDPDALYTLRLVDQDQPSCYGVSPWFLIRTP